MPTPITTQPQVGTSVPDSFCSADAGAGATVVVLWVTDVVCEGAAGFVSMTVVDGPGTVTVLVWVEVTVSVGVVLAAWALTVQASAAPAHKAVPNLSENPRPVSFTIVLISGQPPAGVITRFG